MLMKYPASLVFVMLCTFCACLSPGKPKEPADLKTQLALFPASKDTLALLTELDRISGRRLTQNGPLNGRISAFDSLPLYGATENVYVLEYDYADGAGSEFPWKYQFVLSRSGKLLGLLNALHYRSLDVFTGQAPLLLTLTATSKGNGGHQLYKLHKDTLEQVFPANAQEYAQTYDIHQDNAVYKPGELALHIEDRNKDGQPDLVFRGEKLFLGAYTPEGDWFDGEIRNGQTTIYTSENPHSRKPVELVFLYAKKDGGFHVSEAYTKNPDRP